MSKMTKLLAGMMCLSGLASVQAAPVVYFDLDGDAVMDTNASFTLGDSFVASLYVTDVDGLHGGLISWGTEIVFDNNQLFASGYSIDPGWPLAGSQNNIDNGNGSIELLASSFSAQTGTIKLADISFDSLTTGTSQLSLGELFPTNLTFDAFAGADGYSYDSEVIFNDVSLEITAVPLPATAWLMLSGMVGLMGVMGKQKAGNRNN